MSAPAMRDQFQALLGDNWKVWPYGVDGLVIDIPNNNGTITIHHTLPRWWGPGAHRGPPPPSGNGSHWLGVALNGDEPYEGDRWAERMVADIKRACSAFKGLEHHV